MKKALKILLGIVAVIAIAIVIVVAAVFYFTSGTVDTADAFFDSVKQQDIAKARSFLSEDFKAGTDENALKVFLTDNAIFDFKEASWPDRSIDGFYRGGLGGSVTTENGDTVPIKLTFVKENGTWKINSIQRDAANSLPSKADQVALTKQSMRDFAAGINGKNMESFRQTISKLWQEQVTTEELNKAFATFMEQNLDLTVLEPLEPLFDNEPKINQDGVLVITGHYPTEPSRVTFEHKYIYEDTAWKLVGFSVDIQEAPAGTQSQDAAPSVPSTADQAALGLELVNKTGYAIKEIYISPAAAGAWQKAPFSKPMADGESVKITSQPGADAPMSDMKIVWVDEGEVTQLKDLKLAKASKVTLYYNADNDKTTADIQ